MPAPPAERYLTTGEVARLFHVGEKTVLNWAREGKLPHIRTLGGQRRFPEQTVRMLCAAREIPVGESDSGAS